MKATKFAACMKYGAFISYFFLIAIISIGIFSVVGCANIVPSTGWAKGFFATCSDQGNST